MLVKSPNSAGLILVAAVSGRALAQAVRRAGYRVRVADFFGDDDTAAAAERVTRLPGSLHGGVDAGRLVGVLQDLAEDRLAYDEVASGENERPVLGRVDALILGSGFERLPGLVDELARHFPVTGNSSDTIRRVKDPGRLATDCAVLGIPHPEFSWAEPIDPGNWISKRVGGAGGVHVQLGESGAGSGGRYFQRRIEGQNISVLFVADGEKADIVGFSRQWTSPTVDAPFRYGGAARLRRFDRGDAAMIGGWLSGLTERTELIGLCSADFIRNRGGYHLIESNPRPGATLDIFDTAQAPLIRAHINACRGDPFDLPRFDDSKASLVAYTKRPLAAFPDIDWPAWTADRQSPGTQLDRGDPVCTVFASGRSAEAARCGAHNNLRQLEGAWGGGRP